MKRIVSLALITVLIFTILSGCGENSGRENAGSNKDNLTSSQNAESKQDKSIELSFLCMGNTAADKDDFETVLLPKYVNEEFPNIKINAQKLPEEQFRTTLQARMAAGNGPDLYYWWTLSLPWQFIVKSNYAKDITDSLALKNFNRSVVEAYSFDGKVYAVPSIVQFLGTYYNKDLFNKAGITEVPRDWPSFLEACEKLKAKGITPICMGDKDSWTIQFGLYQLVISSIYPKDAEYDKKLMNGSAKFSDKHWTEVLNKYKTLYNRGYMIDGSLSIGSLQAIQSFIDGKAAMLFSGSWDYASVTKKGAVDFERGFFPLPGNEKGTQVYVAANPGAGTYVNPKSVDVDASMKVLEYWYDGSSPLFEAWVHAYKGQVPSYNGLSFDVPEFKDFFRMFKEGTSFGFTNNNWVNGVSDVLIQKFQEVISGNITIDDLTKALDEKVKQVNHQGD